MNIVFGSAFRNATGQIGRYFDQVADFAAHMGPLHTVRVIAAEGDSTDASWEMLRAEKRFDVEIVEASHGGPMFGSVVDEQRFEQLSMVGNRIFGHVRPEDDALIYVESDLLWDSETIHQLLISAMEQRFDVVAPVVMAAGPRFYDTFVFRDLDGRCFSSNDQYRNRGFLEVSSAGSCLAMRGEVARAIRIPGNEVLVGWCAEARKHGYRIGVDSYSTVNHPC